METKKQTPLELLATLESLEETVWDSVETLGKSLATACEKARTAIAAAREPCSCADMATAREWSLFPMEYMDATEPPLGELRFCPWCGRRTT